MTVKYLVLSYPYRIPIFKEFCVGRTKRFGVKPYSHSQNLAVLLAELVPSCVPIPITTKLAKTHITRWPVKCFQRKFCSVLMFWKGIDGPVHISIFYIWKTSYLYPPWLDTIWFLTKNIWEILRLKLASFLKGLTVKNRMFTTVNFLPFDGSRLTPLRPSDTTLHWAGLIYNRWPGYERVPQIRIWLLN